MAKENVKHPGTSIWLKHIGMQIIAGGSAGCVEVNLARSNYHNFKGNEEPRIKYTYSLNTGFYYASNGSDKNQVSASIQRDVVYKP